jgi:DNA-binding FadR family transcriptional regulator
MTSESVSPIPLNIGGLGRRTSLKRPHKVAISVAQHIVGEITRGRYPPGSKLPSETEMLAQFHVGRGTLREAVRFLEINGVLTVRTGPGGGPVVAQLDPAALAGTLSLFLQLYETRFDAIVEVRKILEPAIAGLAAVRITDDELAAIQASLAGMEQSLDDKEEFLAANHEFHHLVAWASGNPVMALMMSSLHWITDGTPLGVDYPSTRRRSILSAHESIYAGLAARDPEAAQNMTRAHNERYERYLQKYYPAILTTVLRWSDVVS